jgi:hypothetical protein
MSFRSPREAIVRVGECIAERLSERLAHRIAERVAPVSHLTLTLGKNMRLTIKGRFRRRESLVLIAAKDEPAKPRRS